MRVHKNTAYILSEGAHIETRGENLRVVAKSGTRELPLRNLESVVFLVWDGWISAEAARRCSEMKVGVAFATPHGRFLTGLTGAPKGNITLRMAQFSFAQDKAKKLSLAKKIVAAKLRAQRKQLGRHRRDHKEQTDEAERHVKRLETLAEKAECEEELLGVEGEGAREYFGHFPILLKNPIRPWEGRSRRPPRSPENALLSFLYAIATNDCRSALLIVGLDPYLGIYHHECSGKPALALDLVEEFRTPLADQTLMALSNRSELKESDFEENELGWELNEAGRKKCLTTYQERKKEEIEHPWVQGKVPWGLIPVIQARRLARHFREEEPYETFA